MPEAAAAVRPGAVARPLLPARGTLLGFDFGLARIGVASGEPRDVLVTLGYAGWAAGQLEQELLDNAWLTVPADMAIIFELPPEERLVAAMQKLGVDFANLSEVAGHA